MASTGAALAVAGAGAVHHRIGPVTARLSLALAPGGGTRLALPPAGRLAADTHAGPLGLRVGVEEVDLPAARRLLGALGGARAAPREELTKELAADARTALGALALRSSAAALAGGAAACALVFRNPRAVGLGAAVVATGLGAAGATAAATARPRALTRPTLTGPLSRVPALAAAARNARADFTAYSARLAQLTSGVTRLAARLQELPEGIGEDTTRVLWISDVHDNPQAHELVRVLVEELRVHAVVDTGDSTDLGTQVENRQLAGIARLPVPYLWVRGNHDSAATQQFLAALPNVRVLDDCAVVEVAGLRFAGTGDPRFTPVKRLQEAPGAAARELAQAGRALAAAIREHPAPVDVALVHEPAMAGPLHGHVPLVLDGHVHERRHRTRAGTLELTQGSSGGAGLRALDGGDALPLELSVLHFDPATRALVAVDEITVAGVGAQRVGVERRPVSAYAQPRAAR
ncbi:metallophosphoesterase family protein [Kineococcus sp. SYSU DK006]|uniref:metallophosphoesterase family protein n=1 Tax=Kineococcus sp. SYSU DK006 TaxID=3383127 RepID=UPI003D7E7962